MVSKALGWIASGDDDWTSMALASMAVAGATALHAINPARRHCAQSNALTNRSALLPPEDVNCEHLQLADRIVVTVSPGGTRRGCLLSRSETGMISTTRSEFAVQILHPAVVVL
jgi:hypothetical protein